MSIENPIARQLEGERSKTEVVAELMKKVKELEAQRDEAARVLNEAREALAAESPDRGDAYKQATEAVRVALEKATAINDEIGRVADHAKNILEMPPPMQE